MSCFIDINDVTIMRLLNFHTTCLYEELSNEIVIKNLGGNKALIYFLDEIDQRLRGSGGVYVDLAELFKDDLADLEVLSFLIILIINKLMKKKDEDETALFIETLTGGVNEINRYIKESKLCLL